MTKNTKKIILYPREYNKRGETNLHSVMGVTHEGEMVNVKLRIAEEYQGARSAPSIQEFSRTDRKAKSPAIASQDNSPEMPEGIILFTGAIYEKVDKTKNIKHYIASWAHVLREDSDTSSPHIGIGRIKVKKSSSVARMIKNKLQQDITEEERKKLIDQLDSPKSFEYSTVFYMPEKQRSIDKSASLIDTLEPYDEVFGEYYNKGLSFGYYAIACDENMNPVPNKSRELLSQYSPITGDIDTPAEYVNKIKPILMDYIDKHGGAIIIPCYKLNPTNNAKSYYAMSDRLQMIEEVFHTPEGHARANTIVSKTITLPGGRGILFDKTHPLKYEKLNLDLLDSNLKESRVYSSSMTLDYNNEKINTIRVGIIDHNTYMSLENSPSTQHADEAANENNIHDTSEEMSHDNVEASKDRYDEEPSTKDKKEVEDVNEVEVHAEREEDEIIQDISSSGYHNSVDDIDTHTQGFSKNIATDSNDQPAHGNELEESHVGRPVDDIPRRNDSLPSDDENESSASGSEIPRKEDSGEKIEGERKGKATLGMAAFLKNRL